MTPAAWATHEVLIKRKEAFVRNETIDHWPHEFHGTGEVSAWPPSQPWSQACLERRRMIVGESSPLLHGSAQQHARQLCSTAYEKIEYGSAQSVPSPCRSTSTPTRQSLDGLNSYLARSSYLGSEH